MRKVILEIKLYEHVRKAGKETFKDIYSYEVLEVIKIDYAGGIFVDVIECVLKENVSIDELKQIGNMEILNVLKSDDNKHICMVRGQQSHSELDLDLIWTTPSMISEDKVVVSFIGAQKSILKFVEGTRAGVGEIINMSFQKAAYEKQDILSILTTKQREVLAAAYKHGYYDIPRKISSERLSEKVNISKPTLMEHLRKAENRLIGEIMAGYSE